MIDLKRYETDGYVVVADLIGENTVTALNAERDRFADPDAPLSVDIQLVHRSRVIREFAVQGPQIGLAVEVLGPNVCFTHQQFVSKAADTCEASDVPWHQDSGYGRLEPPTDLTVWIALSDMNEHNGCLWVLPESHRLGLQPHHRMGRLMGASVSGDGIALPMAAGDAVLFSGHLMHRSLPNRTDTSRHALYLRYCTPDVVMVSEGNKPVLEDGFSWMVAGESGR